MVYLNGRFLIVCNECLVIISILFCICICIFIVSKFIVIIVCVRFGGVCIMFVFFVIVVGGCGCIFVDI